jgi:hypothetical protein
LTNNPDVTKEEKNFVDYFISPMIRSITKMTSRMLAYESREAFLNSINDIWKAKRVIKSKSEGYKADGIVRYDDMEIMIMEACGGFGNMLASKIQFDRHKGLYGCLAMLRCFSLKYKYGSLSTFEKLEILFLHTKGNTMQLWSVQYRNKMFVLNRIEKCHLSLSFSSKSETLYNCIHFSKTIQVSAYLAENIILLTF